MVSINSLIFDRSIVDGWLHIDDRSRLQSWADGKDCYRSSSMMMIEFDMRRDRRPIPSSVILPNLELAGRHRVEQANARGICVLSYDCMKAKSGLKFIRAIEKRPVDASSGGMGYTLTLTLLDQARFKLTLCFKERGVSGLREAVVLDEMVRSGRIDFDPDAGNLTGWMIDPHGFGRQTPVMQCVAEDQLYDRQFPDHPLSRLRAAMTRLQNSLDFDPLQSFSPGMICKPTWFERLIGK